MVKFIEPPTGMPLVSTGLFAVNVTLLTGAPAVAAVQFAGGVLLEYPHPPVTQFPVPGMLIFTSLTVAPPRLYTVQVMLPLLPVANTDGDSLTAYWLISPVSVVALFVVWAPAVAEPEKRSVWLGDPVMTQVHVKVPVSPGAREAMEPGVGPVERLLTAVPPGVMDGVTLASVEVPLFATVMVTVTTWPLTTESGVWVIVAVKLPMTTVLELWFFEVAVPAEFRAAAEK